MDILNKAFQIIFMHISWEKNQLQSTHFYWSKKNPSRVFDNTVLIKWWRGSRSKAKNSVDNNNDSDNDGNGVRIRASEKWRFLQGRPGRGGGGLMTMFYKKKHREGGKNHRRRWCRQWWWWRCEWNLDAKWILITPCGKREPRTDSGGKEVGLMVVFQTQRSLLNTYIYYYIRTYRNRGMCAFVYTCISSLLSAAHRRPRFQNTESGFN